MVDYHPTVVSPVIPLAALTPLMHRKSGQYA
ncbi:hypothetical protein C8J34_1266 [Rhizobium sp. PP-F2F-G36]|nr:hypothetical protein C8J34_1266 [Rhizobium sp. PP-F2F-G36]